MFKTLEYVQWISQLTLEQRELEKMCAQRFWNKISTEQIEILEESGEKSIYLPILAERNDYEIFKILVKIPIVCATREIAEKIKKGIELLESYRTCDCSSKTGECIRHVKEMKLNVPGIDPTKPILIFGRRTA